MDELNETTVDETIEAVKVIEDASNCGIAPLIVIGAGVLAVFVVAGAALKTDKIARVNDLKAKRNAKKIEKLEKELEDRKNRYTAIEDIESEEDEK